MPSDNVKWAPSRYTFLVKAPGDDKYHEWRIPWKATRDPRTCVKWMVATRKAIRRMLETGEKKKVTEADLAETDDDL